VPDFLHSGGAAPGIRLRGPTWVVLLCRGPLAWKVGISSGIGVALRVVLLSPFSLFLQARSCSVYEVSYLMKRSLSPQASLHSG
jgi:hypothetical protein